VAAGVGGVARWQAEGGGGGFTGQSGLRPRLDSDAWSSLGPYDRTRVGPGLLDSPGLSRLQGRSPQPAAPWRCSRWQCGDRLASSRRRPRASGTGDPPFLPRPIRSLEREQGGQGRGAQKSCAPGKGAGRSRKVGGALGIRYDICIYNIWKPDGFDLQSPHLKSEVSTNLSTTLCRGKVIIGYTKQFKSFF
jgi:hypothetical protein